MNELIQGLLMLKSYLLDDASNYNVGADTERIIVTDVDIERMPLMDAQILYRLGWCLGDSNERPAKITTEDGDVIVANPDQVQDWDEKTWEIVSGHFDNTLTYFL